MGERQWPYLLLQADLLVHIVDLAVDLGGGILGYTDIRQKQKTSILRCSHVAYVKAKNANVAPQCLNGE